MRLGDDAIVFTMQNDSVSVGLLSQTFLREIGAEMVLVPIVSYKTGTGFFAKNCNKFSAIVFLSILQFLQTYEYLSWRTNTVWK